MSVTPLAYEGDFRAAGVTASRAALDRHPVAATSDLAASGVSLCVPAGGDTAAFRRRFRAVTFYVPLCALFVLATGAAVAVYAGAVWAGPKQAGGVVVGFALAVVGFGGMAVVLPGMRWLVGRYRRSLGNVMPAFPPTAPVVAVAIDDPATVGRRRGLNADLADLYLDGRAGLVVAEGYSHRYLIRAGDVVRCRVVQTRLYPRVVVEYRVGGSAVTLAVSWAEVSSEAAKEAIRHRHAGAVPRPPLADAIGRALGISVE